MKSSSSHSEIDRPIPTGFCVKAIGDYVESGTVHDLTDDHVSSTSDGFVVDAPDDASEIRVAEAYIRDRVGAFAVDHAYAASDGLVVVEDEDALFTSFAPTDTEVFARGSGDSIRFEDRPMWIRVEETDPGVQITADDGDGTGQDVRIDEAWLDGFGVEDPFATMGDGTPVPVEATADGYVLEVPHFSVVDIEDPTLDTAWRDDQGQTFEYTLDSPSELDEFNSSVVDDDAHVITFSHWGFINGSKEPLWGETFDESTRESRNRSGYYSHSYINESNLENLEAELGRATYNLTDTTLTSYVFTNGSENTTYYFDKDTGWLRNVDYSSNDDTLEFLTDILHDPSDIPFVDRRPGYAPLQTNDRVTGQPTNQLFGRGLYDPEWGSTADVFPKWSGTDNDTWAQTGLVDKGGFRSSM